MYINFNLWSYFVEANLIIKCIFITLLSLSMLSWGVIIRYLLWLNQLRRAYRNFDNQFWSGIALTELYNNLPRTRETCDLSSIFHAGFTEFYRLRKAGCQTLPVLLEAVERAMRIAQAQARIYLEQRLYWLGIVNGSSPYLGLLGTLMGIVFTLNTVQTKLPQEPLLLLSLIVNHSLIMTLLSLCSTLPAFIFYYRYTHQIDQLLDHYHVFQDEFIAVLLRQAYEEHYDQLSTD